MTTLMKQHRIRRWRVNAIVVVLCSRIGVVLCVCGRFFRFVMECSAGTRGERVDPGKGTRCGL